MALFDNDSVNLKKINFPVMTVTSVNDDLVSFEFTEAVSDHIESPVKKIQVTGGHVGLCIGKKAHDKVWPEVAEWIKTNYVNPSQINHTKRSHRL